MEKIITSSIVIDGTNFLPEQGFTVQINQKMADHHTFLVSFPYESLESEGGLVEASIEYIGKRIYFNLNDGALEFKGIITNVDLHKTEGSNGDLIFSGYSPTILLEQNIQSCSFEEGSTLDQVIQKATEEYATDMISIQAGNATQIKLPYTVQYEEDDFAFLYRLAARYGVWFYYDGANICFGDVGDTTIEGTYGKDINQFHFGARLQSQQFKMKSFDWHGGETYETESDSFTTGVSNTFFSTVKEESDQVYRKKKTQFLLQTQNEYLAQKGVDDVAKIRVLGKAANMILASGVSILPKLSVGAILNVSGMQLLDTSNLDAYGNFLMIEVEHHFTHAGHYRNTWKGIPEGMEHPPYSNVNAYPIAGSQRGIVKENIDPEKAGRVRVQFPWQQEENLITPWIKVSTPYAGSGKGMQFVPEIDEEVLVGFEGNNAERPFVLSAGFSTNAKSELDPADNNIKAITTRSGHTVKFDDTDGSEKISIHDNEGSTIIFDTPAKTLTITAGENLELLGKNITITAEENINLQAEKDITLASEGDFNILSNAKAVFQAVKDAIFSSDAAISINAQKDMALNAKSLKATAQNKTEIKGTTTTVSGKTASLEGTVHKFKIK